MSVLDEDYSDFELAICDDGSDVHISDVLDDMGIEQDDQIQWYRLDDDAEYKRAYGSRAGMMLNDAMSNSNADIAIILCDDDMIYPSYFQGLSDFYEQNPDVGYSFGYVSLYDPTNSEFPPADNFDSSLNHAAPVWPVNMVDASQVSWRLRDSYGLVTYFPEQQTINLDASAWGPLSAKFGPCIPNDLRAQYKGWFWDQMGRRVEQGLPPSEVRHS
jgi:hypothetical protein